MRKLPLDKTLHDIDIFVIVSQISNEIYIWKTMHDRCYKAYKEHVGRRQMRTKELFEQSEQEGEFPLMYRLERVQMTEKKAFQHCVAWTKYFLEHGYSSLSYPMMIRYAEDPLEYTMEIYNSIKERPISDVLTRENCIVSQYRRRQKSNDIPTAINMCVSPKEYDKIQEMAQKSGKSMSSFCRERALNGKIVKLEPYDISEEISAMKGMCYQMHLLLQAFYQNGKYYPADIENIEKYTNEVVEINKRVVAKLNQKAEEARALDRSMKGK